MNYLSSNLYNVINTIDAFYPVPLISSYSDIDDNYGYEEDSGLIPFDNYEPPTDYSTANESPEFSKL